MIANTSIKALRAYLKSQEARHEKEAQQHGRRQPAFFVTLSRQAGAGGSSVAQTLAELLTAAEVGNPDTAWTVFDRNLLRTVVEEHHLPEEFVKDLEEQTRRTVPPIVEDMLGVRLTQRSLVGMTCRTMLHVAAMGNAVIVGRGGSIVTRELPGGFHVRLVGSPEKRSAHLAKRFGLTPREAKSLMKELDDSRRRYVRSYLKQEIEDPLLYDLMVNTDRLGHLGTARVLFEAFRLHYDLGPRAA